MNLVFASGFLVPQRVLGAVEYFNGLRELFQRGGKYFGKHQAAFPPVSPVATSATRANELANGIFGKFPDGDVHIIAHSMAGLDSRVLIANNPNGLSKRIKSLTTISTPHYGTPVADLLTGRRPQDENAFLADIARLVHFPGLGGLLAGLAGLIDLHGLLADIPAVIRFLGLDKGALEDLTTTGANAIPDPIKLNLPYQIRYRSYAAVGRPPVDFPVMQKKTCLLFVPFHNEIQRAMNEESDGLVPFSSTKYGDFQQEWQCDHADAIGHNLDFGLFNDFQFDHFAAYDALIGDLEKLFPA